MKKLLFFLLASCIVMQTYAQNISVKGKVTNANGEPLLGAQVKVKGTSGGTITDLNGGFVISAPQGAYLTITYIGYADKDVKVTSANSSSLNITLTEAGVGLNEIVVVGYGTQKKATLTGAISTISGEELNTTKTQNVQNMMTGKTPGVRIVQKTSEPGAFTNVFDVRGFGSPLVIVDGVPRGTISRMDPNEIESISVLKDAAAAVYGVRAANGVVLITTKKGQAGKAKITYSNYFGYQEAIGLPKPVGVIDRYTLYNERTMHSVDGPVLKYSDDDFAPYLDGTKKSTDWYAEVMNPTAPQLQHNLSISGASKDAAIDYFVNAGYASQGGYWKSNSLQYDRYNFRTNLNAKISKSLNASVKLSGIMDKKLNPTHLSWQIFRALWRAQPNESYYANDNPDYLYKPVFEHPGAFADDEVSGYTKDKNTWIQSQFSLDYKLPFIEGLSAKGSFAYDFRNTDNTDFQKEFKVYDYDAASNTYSPFSNNGPDRIQRAYSNSPNSLLQLSLNYNKTFLDAHNFKALVLYEEGTTSGDSFYAARELGIPLPYLFAGISQNQVANSNIDGISSSATKAWVGRLNYDYKGKYLAEASFRYDASSRFPTNKRWGFFPAGSVGWRVSEEGFIKNNKSLAFIDNLKIRASYGRVGDDSAIDYQYISGYDYPYDGTNNGLPGGSVFDGQFVNAVGFRVYPNKNITWTTSDLMNLGVDADFWNSKLGVTFDVFRRNRSGLLANKLATVPGLFGTLLPQENLNKDQTNGMELALTHRNKFGSFGYNIGGNVAYTRRKDIFKERNRSGNSYSNWESNTTNRYDDIWWGYDYLGQYQNYNQIVNSPTFTSRSVITGDYIYGDWNGDGVFNDNDKHPIATTSQTPLLTFGATLGADYKGFDINMLFQGGALSYVSYGEQLSQPLAFDGNALDFFMDRWHPVDPKADPYDPKNQWIPGDNAYTGTVINGDSRKAIQNGAYLRLKSIELGYSVPKSLLKKAGIQNLRVFTNAYNLFTITDVKGVDPEHPSETYGYLYPLSRTINFGASLTF
nr:TonB-dependent receptor [uncultured Pedobacter sp.]